MIKKKIVCIVFVLGVGMFSLFGCSSSAMNNDNPDSSQAESTSVISAPDEQSSTTILQVQSVEGNNITGLVGTLSELSMDQILQNRPDMSEAPDDGQRENRQPPDGNGQEGQRPQPPDDNGREGQQRRPFSPQQFEAGTDTITFTIDNSTVISTESMPDNTVGSSSDIVTGSVLEVTLNDDNLATSIIVKMTMNNFGDVLGGDPQNEATTN